MRARMGLVVVLAACGGGKSPGDAGGDPRQQVVSVPVTPNRDLDLLFVIDDSGSMADKQNNLAINFPNFINVLTTLEGGLPNLHIGVVTTDMGTKGTAVATPGPAIGTVGQGGCSSTGKDGVLQTSSAPVTDNFISDVRQPDGTRLKNYTGELATVFSQMAKVGASGCGFEQPLHAMKRALDGNPANVGFLRPDALLGVVFLTDEDDCTIADPALFAPGDTGPLGPLTSFRCTRFGVTCTEGGQTSDAMNQVGSKTGCTAASDATLLETIQPFREFLVGLKSDPNKVLVAGIIGPPDPFAVELRQLNGQNQTAVAHSCTYQGPNGIEVADPGVRMKAFFDAFPNRSSFTSVCQPDLSVSLEMLGQLVNRTVGSPCVTDALADVDASTPGLQVDCIVEDVVGASATLIPQCSSPEAPPCWRLDTDAAFCPQLDHLKLVVVRDGPPDPATVTNMRCRVR